jgi:hypothetical protein
VKTENGVAKLLTDSTYASGAEENSAGKIILVSNFGRPTAQFQSVPGFTVLRMAERPGRFMPGMHSKKTISRRHAGATLAYG